ncbi:MraY family glycosyltransferase [Barnesiella sp. An22]|uniref:MraY family glycosyltransferase n=1 Tax=Barnesiella sp. An22 TaxID=1965590 RepID=UPI000B368643|nr:MraY family glycosyltransferase [Barnesiella sp. An22]OUO96711.1 undecaprenyl-phosphate alpha-N-acetylglucosaminyl 1-phosphate transferase [Barnesiella sp. An22]
MADFTQNTDLWIINVSLVFVLCVFLAGIVIPQILLIAFRRKLFDVPDERKIHQGAVPRLGGIAFKPVIFFSVFLLLGIDMMVGHTEVLSEIGKDAQPLFFGFCSIIVLYLVGIADDLIGVKYRAKFFVQVLCGVMLIAGGVYLDDLTGVLGVHELPTWIGYLLTVLATVFIINAINLIDGIDGLASGLCSIACLFYGVIFFLFEKYIYSMLAFATLGVLMPFFYYNVFGKVEHHKKIFMGDTGSLTIGMMLCFLSIRLVQCGADEGGKILNPMILAFSPLIIPCFDVVRVYLHRVRNGKNPFLPDKNHIHHKLIAIGMKQRTVMILIIAVSLLFTLGNILLSKYIEINLLLVIDIAIWTLVNIGLSRRIKKLQSNA